MVERSLSMREVPGSIPGISTLFLFFFIKPLLCAAFADSRLFSPHLKLSCIPISAAETFLLHQRKKNLQVKVAKITEIALAASDPGVEFSSFFLKVHLYEIMTTNNMLSSTYSDCYDDQSHLEENEEPRCSHLEEIVFLGILLVLVLLGPSVKIK